MYKQFKFPSFGVGVLAVGLAAVSAGAVVHHTAPVTRTITVAAEKSTIDGDLVVPPELVPPPGNVLAAVLPATGVQVYRCTLTTPPTGTPTLGWVFVEPVATLAGKTVRTTGKSAQLDKHVTAVHFRGPSWESDQDGSLVEGKAKANSPVPGSIPQLLLEAARNQGTGIFGKVTFVQRLATSGGAAPAGACTEGAVTGVPYRAVYRFFNPAA